MADRFTKLLAISYLKGNEPFVIIDGVFELRYLENQGAAFGLLQNKQFLFFIITVVACVFIVWLYVFRIPAVKRYLPLMACAVLIFAGAIGNFIDRVSNAYVVDFLYFRLINFPVFNVADIFVTVGTALLLILGLFYYKEEDFNAIL
jgi:signal peptidase II